MSSLSLCLKDLSQAIREFSWFLFDLAILLCFCNERGEVSHFPLLKHFSALLRSRLASPNGWELLLILLLVFDELLLPEVSSCPVLSGFTCSCIVGCERWLMREVLRRSVIVIIILILGARALLLLLLPSLFEISLPLMVVIWLLLLLFA
jgi:hypothetical protein